MGGGVSFESSSVESGTMGVVLLVEGCAAMMGRLAQRWTKGRKSNQWRHSSESADGLDDAVVEVLRGKKSRRRRKVETDLRQRRLTTRVDGLSVEPLNQEEVYGDKKISLISTLMIPEHPAGHIMVIDGRSRHDHALNGKVHPTSHCIDQAFLEPTMITTL